MGRGSWVRDPPCIHVIVYILLFGCSHDTAFSCFPKVDPAVVLFFYLKCRQKAVDRYRAVFKWLSKVIAWLRLLRLVIGSKDLRQFFNQWEAKPKLIAPSTRDFSRAMSEVQVIARNCDWFISLAAPVVIGRSNCFGFGFSTVIWKPLYRSCLTWLPLFH